MEDLKEEVKPACRQTSFKESKAVRRPTRRTSSTETTAEVSPVPVKQRSFFDIRDEMSTSIHQHNMPVKQSSFFQTKAEVQAVPRVEINGACSIIKNVLPKTTC